MTLRLGNTMKNVTVGGVNIATEIAGSSPITFWCGAGQTWKATPEAGTIKETFVLQ